MVCNIHHSVARAVLRSSGKLTRSGLAQPMTEVSLPQVGGVNCSPRVGNKQANGHGPLEGLVPGEMPGRTECWRQNCPAVKTR